MSDLTERLRNHTIRFAHESEEAAKIRRNKAVAEAADEIDRLTRELAQARDKALEEAAKVADQASEDSDWMEGAIEAEHIAAAIRALKEKQNAK